MKNNTDIDKIKELFKRSIIDLGKDYEGFCDRLRNDTMSVDAYYFLTGLLVGIYVGLYGDVDSMPDNISLDDVIN
tara:strand:- start:32922 stop:33146 length:225 start_codon:yes stop_codon:yes gene_type:complete